MNCNICSNILKPVLYNGEIGESSTLVGYIRFKDDQGRWHHHDDNCLKRDYSCCNNHHMLLSIRRTCSVEGCNWKGKDHCFCHDGMKVEIWP